MGPRVGSNPSLPLARIVADNFLTATSFGFLSVNLNKKLWWLLQGGDGTRRFRVMLVVQLEHTEIRVQECDTVDQDS